MEEGTQTRFAVSDGVNIAYQVVGRGELDILVFCSALLPMDSIEDEPSLARFHRHLGALGRLIRFDLRGVGMSDPIAPSTPPTLEQWAQDARAVLDAAGSERAAIFAPRDACLPAVMLAATHPDRVTSVVFVNGTARYARADDYPFGWPTAILDRFLEENTDPTDSGDLDALSLFAPSKVGDAEFRSWWVRAGNRGASPAAARAIQSTTLSADVRDLLPAVRVPALVLHRRDDGSVPVTHGRYLAEQLPDARFVELDGGDDLYWVGDTGRMLDEIEEFLTGVRGGAGSDRMLATIVFTDIVHSTATAAALGDAGWHDVLDRHDAALRRQLARFGGRAVKSTGDGLLALFDGPARAVEAACAMRDAAAQLGIEVRVGVHTGEIERRGDDVAGMAVHLAARVEAAAGPGEVLVSRTVVDLVVGSGLEFRDAGEQELNGVPGTWQLFAVR